MVALNYDTKEISCKIVYYGPGLGGKTTNLQIIHKRVPDKNRSEMVSLATESERTLFFDFLPLDLGTIKGYSTKFQLYTVPGQVYYNETRKLVLRGVDGVVFVADSQADKMEENIESFINLEENLAEYGLNLQNLPFVLQYNKRDLPNILPVHILDTKLNKIKVASYEAVALKGTGVFDTLKGISKTIMDKYNAGSTGGASKYKKKAGVISLPPASHQKTGQVPISERQTQKIPITPQPSFTAAKPPSPPPPRSVPAQASGSVPPSYNGGDDEMEIDPAIQKFIALRKKKDQQQATVKPVPMAPKVAPPSGAISNTPPASTPKSSADDIPTDPFLANTGDTDFTYTIDKPGYTNGGGGSEVLDYLDIKPFAGIEDNNLNSQKPKDKKAGDDTSDPEFNPFQDS